QEKDVAAFGVVTQHQRLRQLLQFAIPDVREDMDMPKSGKSVAVTGDHVAGTLARTPEPVKTSRTAEPTDVDLAAASARCHRGRVEARSVVSRPTAVQLPVTPPASIPPSRSPSTA